MLKRFLLMLLLAVTVTGAAAQDEESILLVPFTDNNYGITGLVPSSWTQYSAGLWMRENGEPALLAQQGLVGDFNTIVAQLLEQLQLTQIPEPVEVITANGMDWTLHFTIGPEGSNVVVDWAITTAGASVYMVLLRTPPDERDALRESIFLPVVKALKPSNLDPVLPSDAGYTAENLFFDSGDVLLAATLTIPAGTGPHPAVIFISGSGPQDRDERIEGTNYAPFALIADYLARIGIASLRYDDRGYGRSGGEFNSATTETFAADAGAAFAYLVGRLEVDPLQIGFIGHSEGASAAAHLAELGVPAAFYVLMAGPAVNGEEMLIAQNRRIYAAEGMPEADAEAQIAFITEMFPLIKAGNTLEIARLLDTRVREQVAALSDIDRLRMGDVETVIQDTVRSQLAEFARAWWPYFLQYNPADSWATVTVPVLAIFGALDVQVDAAQNSAALETALASAPTKDYEIITLATANHIFQNAVSGAVSEYGGLQPNLNDEFLPLLGEWLLARVTLPE